MARHAPFKAEFSGICDSKLSTLLDADGPSASISIAPLAAAVAQMIFRSGAIHIDDEKSLHLPIMPLRDVAIGQHRLCPTTVSDFGRFLDQPCVRGSTATLIGPRHVLTAAHSIVPGELIHHHFVFGRTAGATHATMVDKEIIVRKGNYYTAKKLLGYVNTEQVDWAVLELFADVENVEPLAVGRWKPGAHALCLGHPLGLPLKQARIEPIEASPQPTYRVAIDSGSGYSGAPIIQAGVLVGVLRGHAGISPEMMGEHEGSPCIDPARDRSAIAQPFTPAIHFAPALPQIFGW